MTFFEHLLLCINSAANRLTSKGTRKKEKRPFAIFTYPNPVKVDFPWLLTIRKGAGTLPFPLGKPRARVIHPLNPRAPRMWSKPSLMKGEHFCLLLAHTNPVAPEFNFRIKNY